MLFLRKHSGDEARVRRPVVPEDFLVQSRDGPFRALEQEAVDGVVAEVRPSVGAGVRLGDEGAGEQEVTGGGSGAEDVHEVVFEGAVVEEAGEFVQGDVVADELFGLGLAVCGNRRQFLAVEVVCEKLKGLGGAALADVPDLFGSEGFHGHGRGECFL